MSKSNIEWTRETWNPIAGCSILSPGCTHCYAMPMAARIARINAAAVADGKPAPTPHYEGLTKTVNGHPVWTGRIARARDKTWHAPLHRKVPTLFFVNSMSDLFHEAVPDAWIDEVFAIMALTPQHTYQVLTKRSARMRAYLTDRNGMGNGAICRAINDLPGSLGNRHGALEMPLPNVWIGISAERQQEADERIPDLLQTPAAVRFISAEPLLGAIDLTRIGLANRAVNHLGFYTNAMVGHHQHHIPHLDWVIVGGESGPDSRPMHPDWARSLRDQCAAADVPFFFKQWGNWHPEIDRDSYDPDWRQPYADFKAPHFRILNLAGGCGFHGERAHVMRFCSKKSAGRLLDGRIHDAMPRAWGDQHHTLSPPKRRQRSSSAAGGAM